MPSSFFSALSKLARLIDALQQSIVALAQWLVLLMTITVCIVIIGRYFNLGSIALQETITYMHGSLFMLTMAYTAHAGGHVRVDIAYRRFSKLNQAWVNLIGSCVFLLPFALFLCFISWQSAAQSWAIRETSNNPGGLPLVFLLKSLPPATGLLLALHAFSDIFKQLSYVSIHQTDNRANV